MATSLPAPDVLEWGAGETGNHPAWHFCRIQLPPSLSTTSSTSQQLYPHAVPPLHKPPTPPLHMLWLLLPILSEMQLACLCPLRRLSHTEGRWEKPSNCRSPQTRGVHQAPPLGYAVLQAQFIGTDIPSPRRPPVPGKREPRVERRHPESRGSDLHSPPQDNGGFL